MSYQGWTFVCPELWQAVRFPSELPLKGCRWEIMKEVELPLYGCRWTDSVLRQIAKVKSDPERWSGGEQITEDAIRRDQLMLGFILENKLIPFTTKQVTKWLDWYGYRETNNEELEIWYPAKYLLPAVYPFLSFNVDNMIKATSALVDFLFEDSHLFSAKVFFTKETKKDMFFTFVSKCKEISAGRGSKRLRRVRQSRREESQEEANGHGPEHGIRSIDSAEDLRQYLIASDTEDSEQGEASLYVSPCPKTASDSSN